MKKSALIACIDEFPDDAEIGMYFENEHGSQEFFLSPSEGNAPTLTFDDDGKYWMNFYKSPEGDY